MPPSPQGVSIRCASAATPSTKATVFSLIKATGYPTDAARRLIAGFAPDA
jgi:hypothetical protein